MKRRRHGRPATSPTSALRRALARALRGQFDAQARAALAPFDPGGAQPPSRRRRRQPSAKAIGAFAAENLAGVAGLLQSEDSALRHAATFALGHSADARAVAPLMALLCQQQDFYDHDFLYRALADLGAVAVPALARFALGGSEDEAYQAVQALGQSQADVLPALRRVRAKRRRLPKHFYVAYQNRGDPRGLPDLLPALSKGEHRNDALSAAESLLRRASPGQRPGPRQARRWARVLLPLCRHSDVDVHANAIECLALLRVREAGPLLVDLASRPEQVVKDSAYYQRWLAKTALDSLHVLGTSEARGFLAQLTRDASPTTAARAALRLRECSRTDPALLQAVVRGLTSGELSQFDVADVARRDLGLKRALIRAVPQSQGDERDRLAGALIRTLRLGDPSWRGRRARARLLAMCPGPVARLLQRAISAELRRRRES